MQDGGLEVVNVNGVFDDSETKLVGLAKIHARFYTAAGEETRVAVRVVV